VSGSGAPVRIGVLALQGNVREHARIITDLGAEAVPVRTPAQLDGVDAMVLPGGESSTIDKLMRMFDLHEPLRERIRSGMPALGTCAGLILLADRITDAAPGQQTLGGIDVTVRRNAFGAQNQSFEVDLDVPVLGNEPVRGVFIRGPVVDEVGPNATAICELHDGRVVAVKQGKLTGLSFHPEMAGEQSFHRALVEDARATRA